MEISTYNRHDLLGTDPRDLQQTSRIDLEHRDQAIIITGSEIRFFQYDISSIAETEVTNRPFSVRPVDFVDSGVWIEKEVPPSRFSMLKSEYASATEGVVLSAEKVKDVESAGINRYYGTNSDEVVGFHCVPTEVDKAINITGIDSAGNDKYYGTNEIGEAGFFDRPTVSAEATTRRLAIIFG